MASKKTITKTGLAAAKIVYGLSERAETEVAELLKRNKAGTITKSQLDTGLKEVHERLARMLDLIDKIVE